MGFIKSTIFRSLEIAPIKFKYFTGHDFVAWLSTQKRPNGEWFTCSAYTNYRSGLYHLFKNYEQELSPAFELTVQMFFDNLPKDKYERAKKESKRSVTHRKRKTSEHETQL